jgi:hypothetical protein
MMQLKDMQEQCDHCGDVLEVGQIGLCADCLAQLHAASFPLEQRFRWDPINEVRKPL